MRPLFWNGLSAIVLMALVVLMIRSHVSTPMKLLNNGISNNNINI